VPNVTLSFEQALAMDGCTNTAASTLSPGSGRGGSPGGSQQAANNYSLPQSPTGSSSGGRNAPLSVNSFFSADLSSPEGAATRGPNSCSFFNFFSSAVRYAVQIVI
jgi:hypothetical protein